MRASRESIDAFGAELVMRRPPPWRWSYSQWTGYWYGPLPIGAVLAVVAGLLFGELVLL
ncbi:MAG TPA: hypothetical protein VFV99_22215 [Kofleriaceae bacterium]|nr:hypothetical protein [Kofleriaceae bacterium]